MPFCFALTRTSNTTRSSTYFPKQAVKQDSRTSRGIEEGPDIDTASYCRIYPRCRLARIPAAFKSVNEQPLWLLQSQRGRQLATAAPPPTCAGPAQIQAQPVPVIVMVIPILMALPAAAATQFTRPRRQAQSIRALTMIWASARLASLSRLLQLSNDSESFATLLW